eukprot:2907597-Prymnesium_polylepis.1
MSPAASAASRGRPPIYQETPRPPFCRVNRRTISSHFAVMEAIGIQLDATKQLAALRLQSVISADASVQLVAGNKKHGH